MRSNLHDNIGTGNKAINIPHKIKNDPKVLPSADCGIKSPQPIVVKEITAHQNEWGMPLIKKKKINI